MKPGRLRRPIVNKTMMQTTYDGSKLTYHGDDYEDGKVVINETRPLSATKRWRLVEILEKAK